MATDLGADPAFVPAASSQQAVSTKGFNPGEGLDIGFAVHPNLAAAIWAALKRTVRTWRYARSIGADPTHWWGVYEGGTEICLASVGPLPGAERRARRIARALDGGATQSTGETA